MKKLLERLDLEINKTPTGDLRNLLCDVNIALMSGMEDAYDIVEKEI